jgi:hypothetical protein
MFAIFNATGSTIRAAVTFSVTPSPLTTLTTAVKSRCKWPGWRQADRPTPGSTFFRLDQFQRRYSPYF